MRSLYFLATLMLPFLLFSACRNSNVNPKDDTTLFQELKQKLKKKETQLFSIDAVAGGIIQGNDGTKIIFPPNAFTNSLDLPITTGTIDIILVELQKAKDFMLYGGTTFTIGNSFLRSGGQVILTASQGGDAVYSDGFSISFNQAPIISDLEQPMALFNGSPLIWGSETPIGWAVDSNVATTMMKFDETLGNYAYFFEGLSSFGWINCDYWWSNTEPKTDIKVNIAVEGFNQSNSCVFYYAPTVNASSEIFHYSTPTNSFSFQSELIPVGLPVKIIFFGVKDGEDYLYVSSSLSSLTEDFEITITPTVSNLEAISTAMDGL